VRPSIAVSRKSTEPVDDTTDLLEAVVLVRLSTLFATVCHAGSSSSKKAVNWIAGFSSNQTSSWKNALTRISTILRWPLRGFDPGRRCSPDVGDGGDDADVRLRLGVHDLKGVLAFVDER
jgi:hypothetical protein